MKKFLALLMSLIMAFSCITAMAVETAVPAATTTKVSFTLNDQLLNLILYASMTEEDQAAASGVLPLLNHLGFEVISAAEGTQVSLTLKDTPITTAVGTVNEEGGLSLVSTLFPSYIISVDGATVASVTDTAPVMDEDALEMALTMEMVKLLGAFYAQAGEPTTGEFSFEGGTFNTAHAFTMPVDEFFTNVINYLKSLMENAAFAPIFEALAAEGIDASLLDEALADIQDNDSEEEPLPVNVALFSYVNENGTTTDDKYFTIDLADEEFVMAAAGGVVADAVYAHFIFGDAAYSSIDDMRDAAIMGTSEATVIDLAVVPGTTEEEGAIGLDLYSNGLYIGFVSQAALAAEGKAVDVTLYYLTDQMPLITISALTTEGGVITPPEFTEEQTVIALEDLMADEDGTVTGMLTADIMGFGLNYLIGNAAIAMPEEVSALIMMLSAPAEVEETTEIETVEVPTAE